MGIRFRITNVFLEDEERNDTNVVEMEFSDFNSTLLEDLFPEEKLHSDILLDAFKIFVLVLLFALAAFLNGVVAYVLIRKRRLSTSAGNQFLFSLALTNAVMSLLLIPLLLASGSGSEWKSVRLLCGISGAIHLLTVVASNFTVALIAVDRYYAILKPMTYHDEMSFARGIYMLALCWSLALILSLPPVFGWSSFHSVPGVPLCVPFFGLHPVYTSVFIALVFLPPFCIISISYTYIFAAAELQNKTLSTTIRRPNEENERPSSPLLQRPLPSKAELRSQHKLNWIIITYSSPEKALKTISLLLFSFLFPWAFLFAWIGLELTHRRNDAFVFTAFTLHSLSHIAYPIIYGLLNKAVRKRVLRLLWRTKQKQAINLNSSTANPSFLDYLPTRKKSTGKYPGIDPYDIISPPVRPKWNQRAHPVVKRRKTSMPAIRRKIGVPAQAHFKRGRSVPAGLANSRSERSRRNFCRLAVGMNVDPKFTRDTKEEELAAARASEVLSVIQKRILARDGGVIKSVSSSNGFLKPISMSRNNSDGSLMMSAESGVGLWIDSQEEEDDWLEDDSAARL